MIIIKFNHTNVKDFTPFKDSNSNTVNVRLIFMDNTSTVLSKPFEGKFYHWELLQFRNIAWIMFYEVKEVFSIPELEMKSIKASYKVDVINL
jgi:hypothetical protein